jgi:hypothetical protein
MEDKRYLTTFHDMQSELDRHVVEFNQRASGITDKRQLIAIRREQCDILTDIVRKFQRTMDFMEGKPVKPQQHSGEAVLFPVLGGG